MASNKKAIPKVAPPAAPASKGKAVKSGKATKNSKPNGAAKKPKATSGPKPPHSTSASRGADAKFPRHSLEKVLRIPRAIFEQNAGKSATAEEVASFVGVGLNGPFRVELSSAIKFGLLQRPSSGSLEPTPLARKIIRPQSPSDELEGLREAVLNAPEVSDVYKHYRGENLPDDKFLKNTAAESFGIPTEKFEEFKQVLVESLEKAQLIERHSDKIRVLDVSSDDLPIGQGSPKSAKVLREAGVKPTDTCFVMQPFSPPLGDYYEKIYAPAIEKAGLRAVRADADIFGTGKIMDQVWDGINAAKVLVAELTGRNPNVFYELGLAHALEKPVVLVCADGRDDVPFDLQHIRVIYYSTDDPFWGAKLIDKVAENIVSALRNPGEATFKGISQA